jgi:hypothetical protein
MSDKPPLPKVDVRERAHDNISSLLELDSETTEPDRHYRWVAGRPRSVANAKIRGYRFETKEGGVKTRAAYLDDKGDGYMWIQDVVLMSCDLGEWRQRKRKENRQANSRLTAPKKQFKKRARARKVRILNERDE